MIIDIAINAVVLLGLGLLLYGLYAGVRSVFLHFRDRHDAGPLRASLQRLGDNVKARNKRVSANRIEDTFD